MGANQVSGSNSGPTGQGGFNLHYAGERFDTTLDASRSTIANGNGGFVESNNLRGTWGATPSTNSAGPALIPVAKNQRAIAEHPAQL